MRRAAFFLLVLVSVAASGRLAAQVSERWQATLSSGRILYELVPESLAGDTLILRGEDGVRRIPLADVSELRRVRPSVELAERAGRNAIGALSGADDQVYQMTLLDVGEKRAVVRDILAVLGGTEPPPPR
jgi:hypothetical protein